MMAILGLDHINISTARLDETRDFFIRVLGFTEGWRPPFPFRGAWLYQGDKDLVHLAEVGQPPQPSRGSSLDHFAFAITDFEDAQQRLEAAGVRYRALAIEGTAIRQLFFNDPNGATIELNFRG